MQLFSPSTVWEVWKVPLAPPPSWLVKKTFPNCFLICSILMSCSLLLSCRRYISRLSLCRPPVCAAPNLPNPSLPPQTNTAALLGHGSQPSYKAFDVDDSGNDTNVTHRRNLTAICPDALSGLSDGSLQPLAQQLFEERTIWSLIRELPYRTKGKMVDTDIREFLQLFHHIKNIVERGSTLPDQAVWACLGMCWWLVVCVLRDCVVISFNLVQL